MGTYTRTLKRVRKHFVPENLIDICERRTEAFGGFGTVTYVGDQGDFYVHQDNGSKILGIAHLDSVMDTDGCSIVTTKSGTQIVFCPTLDDRLGAYVILDLLPRMGVQTDWLLTVGEEQGASTGYEFARDHVAANGKQYNWMFQFDRTGTDVVMYDYDTPELRGKLKSVGMKPALGSFSDIASMEALGCSGFNVGVGYEDYHGPRSHAWLEDTFSQVARFCNFYYRYQRLAMPYKHDPTVTVWEWHSYTRKDGSTWRYQHPVRKPLSAFKPEELEEAELGMGDRDIVRDETLRRAGTTRYLSAREMRRLGDEFLDDGKRQKEFVESVAAATGYDLSTDEIDQEFGWPFPGNPPTETEEDQALSVPLFDPIKNQNPTRDEEDEEEASRTNVYDPV